jgi:hypothetical protein
MNQDLRYITRACFVILKKRGLFEYHMILRLNSIRVNARSSEDPLF